jgi:hypothetical protein
VAKYRGKAFLIDAFISPSQPIGVLTRADRKKPTTLGLQIATRDYVDTSRWQTLISETSIATVAQGLLAGKYDSGITSLDLAEAYPGVLRIDEVIGTVDDAWLVYGLERTCQGRFASLAGESGRGSVPSLIEVAASLPRLTGLKEVRRAKVESGANVAGSILAKALPDFRPPISALSPIHRSVQLSNNLFS